MFMYALTIIIQKLRDGPAQNEYITCTPTVPDRFRWSSPRRCEPAAASSGHCLYPVPEISRWRPFVRPKAAPTCLIGCRTALGCSGNVQFCDESGYRLRLRGHGAGTSLNGNLPIDMGTPGGEITASAACVRRELRCWNLANPVSGRHRGIPWEGVLNTKGVPQRQQGRARRGKRSQSAQDRQNRGRKRSAMGATAASRRLDRKVDAAISNARGVIGCAGLDETAIETHRMIRPCGYPQGHRLAVYLVRRQGAVS